MTATVSGPSRTWAATHRMLLAVVAVAVVLAAAFALVLASTSTSTSSTTTSVPVEEELTDTQRACELARVVGC
jgi:Tfp pilus assembly protein PilO